MTDEKRPAKLQHNVIMESRKHITVTGVVDIDSFDEQTVTVFTDLGELCIKGRELHINKIDVETGDLVMEGAVESLAYTENLPQRAGLFAKLFR
jgi:sporulation protein YabP